MTSINGTDRLTLRFSLAVQQLKKNRMKFEPGITTCYRTVFDVKTQQPTNRVETTCQSIRIEI